MLLVTGPCKTAILQGQILAMHSSVAVGLYVPTTPEGGTCSPLSGTTWLPEDHSGPLDGCECTRHSVRLELHVRRLVLREQQTSDTLEGLVVGHTHDHPSPGVAEIALEGQPPGEGGPAEHGHQLL